MMFSELMETPRKVIELTGAPGSGKTTFIEKNYPDRFVLLGGLPLSFRTGKRVLYSIVLFLYAIRIRALSLGQIWWLVKKAVTYDETLFAKINALRNSITKFGYNFFERHTDASLIIDEGISHIPFILGLENKEISDFIYQFNQHLAEIRIIFIDSLPKEILEKRIIKRGHKRVRAGRDVERFVAKNTRIAEYYKRALIDAGFDITLV